jgi:hypothetical protein
VTSAAESMPTDRLKVPELPVHGLDGVRSLVGVELPPSRWVTVDRDLLVGFDGATGQQRSLNYAGPENATAGHAAQSLGILMGQWDPTVPITGFKTAIAYGFDRVRFPASLALGSRVRARFTVVSVEEIPSGFTLLADGTLEAEGAKKPVCVARVVLRLPT